MNIIEQLKQLELNDQEIGVYLICLEFGESTLAQIVVKQGSARSTIKYILEKLDKRGLIEIIQKNRSHIYMANPPRTILKLLKNKQAMLNQQINTFEAILPQLNQVYSSSARVPVVRFFSGHEIRKIYEEILASPIEETLFIGEMDKTAEVVGLNYLKKWMQRRSNLHIKTRAIRVQSGEVKDTVINSQSKSFLRSVRLAPKNFESPNHIIIYGSNVASISTIKEGFGFVVTSKDYATTMKNLFTEVWKNSTVF